MDYSILINKPKTKKGRETLDRIVSAAAQVFYEKGYHNSSINDIAECAGVATGTFYIYFDSKLNLYKFLLLQCSHIIRKNLVQATKDCQTRRDIEEIGLASWLDFVQKNRYVYHIIWESLYIDKQMFIDYYKNFAESYIKGLDAAKASGGINPEIDTEVLAWTLMGATNFLGLNWGIFNSGTGSSAEVSSKFMRILSGDIFTSGSETSEEDNPSFESDLPIKIELEYV